MSKVYASSSIQPKAEGTRAFRIVLHESLNQNEYVVHMETLPDGGFHNGDYYRAAKEAVAGYIARCEKYNLNPWFSIDEGFRNEYMKSREIL